MDLFSNLGGPTPLWTTLILFFGAGGLALMEIQKLREKVRRLEDKLKGDGEQD